MDGTMFRRLPCIRVDGEKAKKDLHEVIEEVPLALFVNGRHMMTAMMSPVPARGLCDRLPLH